MRTSESRLQQDAVKLSTTLEGERAQMAQTLATLEMAQQELSDAFKALAAESLKSNNESFLTLAKQTFEKFQNAAQADLEKRHQAIGTLVLPVKESLEKVQEQMRGIETVRAGAYAGLTEQVKHLAESDEKLRSETANLVKALRAPQVRGRWGEIQLKRVVELAGMVEYCDFQQQVSETTDEGRLRPDLVVRLPGELQVIVDAKVPLAAYLEALEAPDEASRQLKLKEHVRQLRSHVAQLSRKSYWEQFQPSPDFVILFLPGEAFYNAALEQDPQLIEEAVGQRVMIATPVSLITLLRTVALSWRQQALAQNAQEISELGKTLYNRLATLGDHLIRLGRSLEGAVENYNKTIGSVETQVLSAARRFRDLEAADGSKEIAELESVDAAPRKLTRIELLPAADSAAAQRAREEGAATAAEL